MCLPAWPGALASRPAAALAPSACLPAWPGALTSRPAALTSRPAAAPAPSGAPAPPAAAPARAAPPASGPRPPSAAAPAPPPSSSAAAPGVAALPPPENGEQGQGLRPGRGWTRQGDRGLGSRGSEIVRGRAQGHPKQGASHQQQPENASRDKMLQQAECRVRPGATPWLCDTGLSRKPSGLDFLIDQMETTVISTPREDAEFAHVTHLERCLARGKYSTDVSH